MLSSKLLLCAKLSEIAYLPPSAAEERVRALGCVWFKFFDNTQTDTQAIAVLNGDAVIIAFRGTSSWRDIETDLNHTLCTPISEHPNLQLHEGFCQAVASMIPIGFLVNGILDASEEPPTIIFTGHSMGGAEAQIAAILLATTRQLTKAVDIQVVTFGSPSVTNHANAKRKWPFGLTMFEVYGDPVPGVPGEFFDYEHLVQRRLISLPNRGMFTLDHPIAGYVEGVMMLGDIGS